MLLLIEILKNKPVLFLMITCHIDLKHCHKKNIEVYSRFEICAMVCLESVQYLMMQNAPLPPLTTKLNCFHGESEIAIERGVYW